MNHFDAIAKGFDTDKRKERARIIADEIRTHIEDGGDKSALEYGCGTGLVGINLANEFRDLLLVDSSPEMIAQADIKLAQLNNPAIATLCADFTTAIPVDLQVDYIFLSLVLHHIKDADGILRRFYDALNDDGHLLVVDLDVDDGSFHGDTHHFDGHNGFDQSALMASCKNVGFQKAEAKTFFFGNRFTGGRDVPYSLFVLDASK